MKTVYLENDVSPIDKKYIAVQNIVQSYDGIQDAKHLFIRKRIVNDVVFHSTDTYINFFHYSRWKYLTCIDSFFLKIECSGKGIIYLYAVSPENIACDKKNCINNATLIDSCVFYDEGKHCWTFEIKGHHDLYFLAWSNKTSDRFKITSAFYICYDCLCLPDVRIAIITPTFRNNKDVIHRAKKYRKFCKDNANFQKFLHLFIVNNEIKDADCLSVCERSGISLINNKSNIGGAGGFAQGVQIALEQGGFTHVLFMDDDALVHEESWFRTISLLKLLKQEFRHHPISGAMFLREEPSFCHAMIEVLNCHLLAECLCGSEKLDASDSCSRFLSNGHAVFNELYKSEGKAPYPYAPWWYCVYPIETFAKHGYPGPFFFRGDDMEYALRLKKVPLFINGICVWHPDFTKKYSLLRVYLNFRNYALRCIIHLKNYKREILKFYCRYISRALAANDYEKVATIILGIEDCIKFNTVPREGEKLIPHVNSASTRWKNKEEKIFSCDRQANVIQSRNSWFSFFCVIATLGGVLVPRILMHSYTVAPFLQVKGRWASARTSYPGESVARCMQERKSFSLCIRALCSITKFLFTKNLKQNIELF